MKFREYIEKMYEVIQNEHSAPWELVKILYGDKYQHSLKDFSEALLGAIKTSEIDKETGLPDWIIQDILIKSFNTQIIAFRDICVVFERKRLEEEDEDAIKER